MRVVVAVLLLGTCVNGFAPLSGVGLGLRTHAVSARGAFSRAPLAPLGLSLRRSGRAGRGIFPSLRSQSAGSDIVQEVQQQIEAGLIIGLPEASEAEVEELMAILTVTARSLTRKLASSPGSVPSIGQSLLDTLATKYVEEEALLTAAQWGAVRASVRLPAEASAAPADPASVVTAAEAGLSAKLEAYIAQKGVAAEDGGEMKAIALAISRSLARRATAGKVPSEGLAAAYAAEVRARLTEEGLMSPSEWDAMAGGAAAGGAVVAGGGGAPPPRAVEVEAPPIERASQFIDEMERLFPAVDKQTLTEAAQGQDQLEDAVYNVIQSTAKKEEAAELAAQANTVDVVSSSAPVSAPAPGGMQTIQTALVTTGACGFGMCMDIVAKDKPITITGIKTASSPGLNWGQGGKIKCGVYVAEGSSRGKELDPSKWTKVGQNNDLTLPMVSWADSDPQFANVPLDVPIRIEAGCTAGITIHTNDLYGLVLALGSGGGGAMLTFGMRTKRESSATTWANTRWGVW